MLLLQIILSPRTIQCLLSLLTLATSTSALSLHDSRLLLRTRHEHINAYDQDRKISQAWKRSLPAFRRDHLREHLPLARRERKEQELGVLDPFGFLGNQPQGATGNSEDPEVPGNPDFFITITPAKTSTLSSNAKSTGIATTANFYQSSTQGSEPSQSTSDTSSPTPTSGISNIPTTHAIVKATNNGGFSWKMIAYGIAGFIIVLTVIFAFTFFDTWWNGLLKPKIFGRKGDDYILDWHRGSWGFNTRERNDLFSGLEANHEPANKHAEVDCDSKEESEKPRVGNMMFPLPPVSPFPVRRTTSGRSQKMPLSPDATLQGLDTMANKVCETEPERKSNNLLSPLQANTISSNTLGWKERFRNSVSLPSFRHKSPRMNVVVFPPASAEKDSDAYGGMEDVKAPHRI